ncbi:MAG: hypothetical protein CL920_36270 [Deltaproteobacteria bacterium]|mgnify:CR=1 FL=1|nr:hypothetical protein [Deltaproteobacteria bacterium]MBU54185.1 hypothetical protein [Deltaproteobacteria bacterium]
MVRLLPWGRLLPCVVVCLFVLTGHNLAHAVDKECVSVSVPSQNKLISQKKPVPSQSLQLEKWAVFAEKGLSDTKPYGGAKRVVWFQGKPIYVRKNQNASYNSQWLMLSGHVPTRELSKQHPSKQFFVSINGTLRKGFKKPIFEWFRFGQKTFFRIKAKSWFREPTFQKVKLCFQKEAQKSTSRKVAKKPLTREAVLHAFLQADDEQKRLSWLTKETRTQYLALTKQGPLPLPVKAFLAGPQALSKRFTSLSSVSHFLSSERSSIQFSFGFKQKGAFTLDTYFQKGGDMLDVFMKKEGKVWRIHELQPQGDLAAQLVGRKRFSLGGWLRASMHTGQRLLSKEAHRVTKLAMTAVSSKLFSAQFSSKLRHLWDALPAIAKTPVAFSALRTMTVLHNHGARKVDEKSMRLLFVVGRVKDRSVGVLVWLTIENKKWVIDDLFFGASSLRGRCQALSKKLLEHGWYAKRVLATRGRSHMMFAVARLVGVKPFEVGVMYRSHSGYNTFVDLGKLRTARYHRLRFSALFSWMDALYLEKYTLRKGSKLTGKTHALSVRWVPRFTSSLATLCYTLKTPKKNAKAQDYSRYTSKNNSTLRFHKAGYFVADDVDLKKYSNRTYTSSFDVNGMRLHLFKAKKAQKRGRQLLVLGMSASRKALVLGAELRKHFTFVVARRENKAERFSVFTRGDEVFFRVSWSYPTNFGIKSFKKFKLCYFSPALVARQETELKAKVTFPTMSTSQPTK